MRACGSGGDRIRASAEIPEKDEIFKSGAAEGGAVELDAADESEYDRELNLVMEAWPALSRELRLAILAIASPRFTDSTDPRNSAR